jgi:hypothetical protein
VPGATGHVEHPHPGAHPGRVQEGAGGSGGGAAGELLIAAGLPAPAGGLELLEGCRVL